MEGTQTQLAETEVREIIEQMEQSEDNQEPEIFYDRREPQRIPLIVPRGIRQIKIWHHLKPLSNERYFQFGEELETVQNYEPREVKDIYKPHYDLWRELFIEREAAKETDSDSLFYEAVKAIDALLYYEKVSPVPSETIDESDAPLLFDDNADIETYFGAAYSGAWLGLTVNYKSDFDSLLDEYLTGRKPIRKLHRLDTSIARLTGKIPYGAVKNMHFTPSKRDFNTYNLALPYITKVEGYAKTENLIDAVPAWHIIKSTEDIFSQTIQFLNDSPIINQVRGQ